jgi:hypothetical protein
MRVDCYNACECTIDSIEYGDTFYYKNTVCIRVNATMLYSGNECAYVRLDTGELFICNFDMLVIKADTKVVANTKDAF